MDGGWSHSWIDISVGRNRAGFGVPLNIINGGIECGPGAQTPTAAAGRGTQHQNICGLLGVDPGSSVDCTSMNTYGG